MHSDAKRFTEEFHTALFRHSEHLITGIRAEEILLHSASEDSDTPASHYLDLYEFRLKRLAQRREHTAHTTELQSDVEELVNGLSKRPDECCDLWIFTENPHFGYSVWVGRESRTIFGCIRGVDDRLVTPEIRSALWGD